MLLLEDHAVRLSSSSAEPDLDVMLGRAVGGNRADSLSDIPLLRPDTVATEVGKQDVFRRLQACPERTAARVCTTGEEHDSFGLRMLIGCELLGRRSGLVKRERPVVAG